MMKMRTESEVKARIDDLERLYDARAAGDASQATLEPILREIAVLRWVLGGSGAIPFRS